MRNVLDWSARHPAVLTALKTVAAALLLAGVVHYVDLATIGSSLRSARLDYLGLGLGMFLLQLWMQFVRWRYLLRTIRLDARPVSIMQSLGAGYTAGFFTPAQLGEIGGRLYGLPPERRSAILMMAALDKFYILGMTVVLGLSSAVVYFPAYLPSAWNTGFSVLASAICVVMASVMLVPSLAKRVLVRLPERIRAHRFFNPVRVFEADFSSRTGINYTVMTFGFLAIIIIQYHCFINAFASAPVTASVLCVPIVWFIKSIVLPISIGDLGVRESASVFFYLRMGVSAPAALNGSLCIFIVNVVLPAVLGIGAIMKTQQRK